MQLNVFYSEFHAAVRVWFRLELDAIHCVVCAATRRGSGRSEFSRRRHLYRARYSGAQISIPIGIQSLPRVIASIGIAAAAGRGM